MTFDAPGTADLHFVTYHEIAEESGNDIYKINSAQLEKHLNMLRELNPGYSCHRVTFDDGHISNYELALPLIERFGMRAIFFITTDWIGAEHRMSETHLRALLDMGHLIGSHSCSHPFLNECSNQQLQDELQASRKRLEDLIGSLVTMISIPYGRWDRRVLRACKTAGYLKVFTSDPWLSSAVREGVEVVGRMTVRNSMDASRLRHLITSRGLVKARLQMPFRMKQALRMCIGDRMYHRIWHAFANREQAPAAVSYGRR